MRLVRFFFLEVVLLILTKFSNAFTVPISKYWFDLENITPEEQKTITDYGRSVITENQYFEIGTVKALENYIEFTKTDSKKKNQRKRIRK